MKTLRINAPEYYGNAMIWALGQIEQLKRQGYKVMSCDPVANELHELVCINVKVLQQ